MLTPTTTLTNLCIPQVVEKGIKVYKGTNSEVDSYSVFWDNKKLSDTTLIAQLKMKGVTDIYVCGLAYDVCVGEEQPICHLIHSDLFVFAPRVVRQKVQNPAETIWTPLPEAKASDTRRVDDAHCFTTILLIL